MGISDGARAGCSRASPGVPACGKHGCHDRPEAEPRPCGVPRPPRGMPPGRPRWPPAEPRPRSRASVPGALLVGAQRWPAAGISWRRTRNGQNPRPDPLEAVGQTRAGRGGGTHRRDLRRPKGPDVSVSPVPPAINCAGDVQFRLYRIALAFLERGIVVHAQLPRQKFHRLSTQKPQGVGVGTAGQGKPGPGKTWGPRCSPSFTTGPSGGSQNWVMFRSSLDTSNGPRKSGPTQIELLSN